MPLTLALSIAPVSDLQTGIIRGVFQYVAGHDDLAIYKEGALPYLSWDALRRWRGDGIIATAETAERAAHLERRSIPAVSVSGHLPPSAQLPSVRSDDGAIGRIAAEHLLEQGLRRFAYVGHFSWHHDRMRLEGFRRTIEHAGHECQAISVALARKLRAESLGLFGIRGRDITNQLSHLAGPIGVGVTHDDFAHEVVQACHNLGRRVPDDIAVVGVNDYRLICESTQPPISSIQQQAERIGYQSAQVLHSLMRGGPAPAQTIIVPPGELVVRRSSDFMAVDDPLVRLALHEIRRQCHESVTVEDIADRLPVTRRTLDKRFVSAVGHTSADELRRSRIKHAMRLLTTTDLQIVAVALRSGFKSTSGFIRAFREETGITPRRYRLRNRSPL